MSKVAVRGGEFRLPISAENRVGAGVAARTVERSRICSAAVEHGEPVSYLTLQAGTDVVSSDGEVVGKVQHVLADTEEDVFDGLVIDTRLGPGGLRFVDADQVQELYERAAMIDIPAHAVEQLPKPTPAPAAMESHGTEDSESPLQSKLRRAWDLISGDY